MITSQETIVRLLVAVVLGGLVGLERERRERGAGLRTHALVSVGAALIIIVSAFGFSDAMGGTNVSFDPSRVAAQVVSGVGFLGAGTIILRREVVRGLTTAASIWVVAGIGLAAGAGLYLAAVACTAIVLVLLTGVRAVERYMFVHHGSRRVSMVVERDKLSIVDIEDLIERQGLDLENITLRPITDEGNEVVVSLQVYRIHAHELTRLRDSLSSLPGVRSVESPIGAVRRGRFS